MNSKKDASLKVEEHKKATDLKKAQVPFASTSKKSMTTSQRSTMIHSILDKKDGKKNVPHATKMRLPSDRSMISSQ